VHRARSCRNGTARYNLWSEWVEADHASFACSHVKSPDRRVVLPDLKSRPSGIQDADYHTNALAEH